MIRFLAIAALLVCLIGPIGDVVVGAVEVGYAAKDSNTRLVAVGVAQQSGGALRVVPLEEYDAPPGEER